MQVPRDVTSSADFVLITSRPSLLFSLRHSLNITFARLIHPTLIHHGWYQVV